MNGEELRFAAWLYRIALNQVRSEWRKRKHVTWIPLSSPQSGNENSSDETGEEYLVSEERFEESVLERDLVQRVLVQLPPASAMCLLLDAEGYSYNEIAETMQDSLSAVRSRLSRARQTFQRIYNSLDQEAPS
jgi:RNA polymerase sigma-70 factor (ECF subfamily)